MPCGPGARADGGEVERPEPELQRGAVGLQAEVVVVRIHEAGIGDDRVRVEAASLPGLEAAGGEFRLRAVGVPVQVMVQRDAVRSRPTRRS